MASLSAVTPRLFASVNSALAGGSGMGPEALAGWARAGGGWRAPEQRQRAPAGAENECSLRLQPRRFHDRADAMVFAADEIAELRGRHERHVGGHHAELAGEL